MCEILRSNKRVINVDESFFNETNFIRKIWTSSDAPATVTNRTVSPRVAMIAALDTDGRIYFTLAHSTTDSDIMLLFL